MAPGGNQLETTPCGTRHCDPDQCTSLGLHFYLFRKIFNFPYQGETLTCVVAHSVLLKSLSTNQGLRTSEISQVPKLSCPLDQHQWLTNNANANKWIIL